MMSVDEMKRIRNERGYSMALLSSYSGVPQGTLTKIFSGVTKNPRLSTLAAVERVLLADESRAMGKSAVYQSQGTVAYGQDKTQAGLKDAPAAAYDAGIPYYEDGKADHTIDEWFALPDDVRMELIDGRFFYMESPTFVHQAIAGDVYASLLAQIRARGGKCRPFISPIGVQLDEDDRTAVQPDVIIVCHRERILKRVYYGAPDFILEVLSPSTRKKDMTLKLQKYVSAGVREYVMIDPKNRKMIAYRIENDMDCLMQPLEGSYGLAIYNGEITLDLDQIREDIEEYGTDREETDLPAGNGRPETKG